MLLLHRIELWVYEIQSYYVIKQRDSEYSSFFRFMPRGVDWLIEQRCSLPIGHSISPLFSTWALSLSRHVTARYNRTSLSASLGSATPCEIDHFWSQFEDVFEKLNITLGTALKIANLSFSFQHGHHRRKNNQSCKATVNSTPSNTPSTKQLLS